MEELEKKYPVIDEAVAQSEIEQWLNFKKIGAVKREAHKDHIKTLVEAIVSGELVLNSNKSFSYTLKFPLEKEKPICALEFKARLSVLDIHTKLQDIKASDGDGRLLAHIAALTGQAKQIIRFLDSEDYNVCCSIAVFFL
jgi:hypothetical protein